jgi:acid phosphatase (class A)
MLEKHLPTIGIIGLVLLVGGYFFVVLPQEAARKDALTFSNTMTWNSDLLALSNEPTHYPAEEFAGISLPPPPKNSSREATDELGLLKSYRALRTPQEISNIISEEIPETMPFGGHTLATYMDEKQFPATALLLTDSFHDVRVITMREKKEFNRVRPSALDTSLDTAIEVPGHPAYPSGHSTEIHFIAYVFGELALARKEEFVDRADQIAKNREVAGLHYPSDTAAGILLARQIFADLMKDPKFNTLLAAAKKEWVAKGLTVSTTSSK